VSTEEWRQAVRILREYTDWLYERGPDLDGVTRESLLESYRAWVAECEA
jgi:hypothetical protein